MSNTRITDVLTTVRAVADQPRSVEGIAVPYGMVATDTEIGRETFAPGAFRESVAHWMGRQDGARMAFRPAHREKPIGTVTHLEDTPDGVRFRASIMTGPAGDEYLAQVAEGLNGVSVEAGLDPRPARMRDGTAVHRTARLYAIAGSVNPAYDGARVSLRDMEDPMPTEETPTTEAVTPEPAAPTITQRQAVLEDAAVVIPSRSPIVISRDALIYGREAASLPDGSHPSFLSDGWKASQGDRDAAERQYRYERATTEMAQRMERDAVTALRAGDVVASEIPGAYPNEYLPGLLTPRVMKGRPMGSFFQRVPISDGTPKIFPKVTTSTSVAVQGGEGVNPAASDLATTAVTATPLLYGAETVVSRQVLDGSSPAAEAMIMQDMIEAYAQASETVIKTAVEAGASASGVAITKATPYAGTVAQLIAYGAARMKNPTGQFYPSALFAVLAAEQDTSGRILLPSLGPVNADGVLLDTLGYNLIGAQGYMSYASTADVVVTARRDDYVIFESAISRFSYDAVTGPAAVRIGIWAYLVVGTRLGGLKVTAA